MATPGTDDERREQLARNAENPAALEAGAFQGKEREARPRARSEVQQLGLRAIDQYEAKGGLRSDAADRLDDLVRNRDRVGLEARAAKE